MTAGSEHAGLHKRWLERKLEIEVGKVQAKLLSKGLSVPVPDAETLETGARLAHSHLPKLYVELYGRNPNGTLKIPTDQHDTGPPAPATLVQKLDRLLNPALLTPIPDDVAAAHGLPLSCCDIGADASYGSYADGRCGGSPSFPPGRPAMHLPLHQLTAPGKQGTGASGAGAGGGLSVMPSQRQVAAENSGTSVAQRTSRSPPPQLHWRPDLQGADARIDDAMAEVQRVAMQANEMSPRERVLYLAKQANPNFTLPLPRNAYLVGMATEPSRSRRDMLRRSSSRRVTSFIADPTRQQHGSLQGSPSRRSYINGDGRRSRASGAVSASSQAASGGGAPADGALPPLGSRSRSVGRSSSSSPDPVALESADSTKIAWDLKADAEPESLPPLSPSASLGRQPSGERGAQERDSSGTPLPRLPAVQHQGGAMQAKPDTMIGLWGAAAMAHAADLDAAAAAQAEVEAAAIAEEEAAAAAAFAQEQAAAEAAVIEERAAARAAAKVAQVEAKAAAEAETAAAAREAMEAAAEAALEAADLPAQAAGPSQDAAALLPGGEGQAVEEAAPRVGSPIQEVHPRLERSTKAESKTSGKGTVKVEFQTAPNAEAPGGASGGPNWTP